MIIMKKNLIEEFKGGFTMYHSSDKRKRFPEEWLLDSENSTNEELYFQAYDANLMPLPNIIEWPKHSRDEMVQKIAIIFKNVHANIYLDGHLLNIKERKLSIQEDEN